MKPDIFSLPSEVKIMEVGPRDGLQNEKTLVDTPTKIQLVNDLADAGLKRIEVTAFVSPKWIPPMADHAEVMHGIARRKDVTYAALVPNMQGYEGALASGVDEIALIVSASNTHNIKNLNADTETVWERCREVGQRAVKDGIPFRIYISCICGCPYEGEVPLSVVSDLTKRTLDLGAYEVSLGDTIGIGDPNQTARILEALLSFVPLEKVAMHLHDTYGRALANAYVALAYGVTSFDASVGGMGGCPYATGAAGNLASEDLISMLDHMGVKTGVSLKKLCKISRKMEGVLGRKLSSKALAAHV